MVEEVEVDDKRAERPSQIGALGAVQEVAAAAVSRAPGCRITERAGHPPPICSSHHSVTVPFSGSGTSIVPMARSVVDSFPPVGMTRWEVSGAGSTGSSKRRAGSYGQYGNPVCRSGSPSSSGLCG